MKILVPNATGPTNIGDQAILTGLLNVLENTFNDFELVIHSSTPEKYTNPKYKIKPHIYYWTVFENPGFLTRVTRMLQVLLAFGLRKLGIKKVFGNSVLKDLIQDYESADLIVFAGGGFIRSNPGFTQALNLFMILFQFSFAKQFKARKVVAPGSFGPFAHSWQERMSANVLRGFDAVTVREQISLDMLEKLGMNNVILSADQALLIKKSDHGRPPGSKFILGFTVREWRTEEETQNNCEIIIQAIEDFSKPVDLVVRPIIQVSSIGFGDLDVLLTDQIIQALRGKGVNVMDTTVLKDLDHAIQVYNEIDLILGMRMHSNIIAATQEKPFVAIAYEHKTRGISQMLGLEKYCLDYSKFSADDLIKLLGDAYKDKEQVNAILKKCLVKIRESEFSLWESILKV